MRHLMKSDPADPAMRRYQGFIADSARWERFTFRPDDVVISTPSKCGTTWMQMIVGMLLLDRLDLGAPISTISPWLDMLTRSDDEVFGRLSAQKHRRFVKTHTPLDGVPRHDSVTYIAVARHPLDVALSHRDHGENQRRDHLDELRVTASGPVDPDLPTVQSRLRNRATTSAGSSTTRSSLSAVARMAWRTTASRSARTGRPVIRRTSTYSTTPTCGPTSTARCGGSRRHSRSRSTRTDGRGSSMQPG